MVVIFGSVGAVALIVAIVAVCCGSLFVGFFECVGSKKYDYTMQEIHNLQKKFKKDLTRSLATCIIIAKMGGVA